MLSEILFMDGQAHWLNEKMSAVVVHQVSSLAPQSPKSAGKTDKLPSTVPSPPLPALTSSNGMTDGGAGFPIGLGISFYDDPCQHFFPTDPPQRLPSPQLSPSVRSCADMTEPSIASSSNFSTEPSINFATDINFSMVSELRFSLISRRSNSDRLTAIAKEQANLDTKNCNLIDEIYEARVEFIEVREQQRYYANLSRTYYDEMRDIANRLEEQLEQQRYYVDLSTTDYYEMRDKVNRLEEQLEQQHYYADLSTTDYYEMRDKGDRLEKQLEQLAEERQRVFAKQQRLRQEAAMAAMYLKAEEASLIQQLEGYVVHHGLPLHDAPIHVISYDTLAEDVEAWRVKYIYSTPDEMEQMLEALDRRARDQTESYM